MKIIPEQEIKSLPPWTGVNMDRDLLQYDDHFKLDEKYFHASAMLLTTIAGDVIKINIPMKTSHIINLIEAKLAVKWRYATNDNIITEETLLDTTNKIITKLNQHV